MKNVTFIFIMMVCAGAIWGTTVSPQCIIVDDYKYESLVDPTWYYTRIGTDRGTMGGGTFTASIGGGKATVNVTSGWAGVWTALAHNAAANDALNPAQILGPYVRSPYQPYVSGVEVDINPGGSGTFKIELKDKNNNPVAVTNFTLSGAQQTLQFLVTPTTDISKLNWLVEGPGNAEVKEVRLLITSPSYTILEAAFLFTYGHLSQCYDAGSGLVRDRSYWPANDRTAVQTIGAFALASAIGADRGYVDDIAARAIIQKTKSTILGLPKYKGLLPHFLKNGGLEENSEWSSVDTVITLVSEILACQAIGEDASGLQDMLKAVDWNDLTDNGTHSIGMGYDYNGQKLSSAWDTFGAEAFIVAVAYSAATGDDDVRLDQYSQAPTWDGSGFNDELAALFFPTTGIDIWGNDWTQYRTDAFNLQAGYNFPSRYTEAGLFGLSAGEVPEPWTVADLADVYQAWGVGGHNNQPNDGTSTVGYPIISPHYAAMIAAEQPQKFQDLFYYLLETKKIFTPLNNVESFGVDTGGVLHWNALKGSWNLCLQVLGAGRAISKGNYLPYAVLNRENNFLAYGFDKMMPLSIEITSPNGGETLKMESKIHITWKASRIKRNLKITLWRGNTLIGTIAYNISPASGSYSWTVGATSGKIVRPIAGYKIKIKEIGGPHSDESDSTFTIIE